MSRPRGFLMPGRISSPWVRAAEPGASGFLAHAFCRAIPVPRAAPASATGASRESTFAWRPSHSSGAPLRQG